MDDLRRVRVGSGEPSSVSPGAVGMSANVIFPVETCGEVVIPAECSWRVSFASVGCGLFVLLLACPTAADEGGVVLFSERDVFCRECERVSLSSSPSRDDISSCFLVVLAGVDVYFVEGVNESRKGKKEGRREKERGGVVVLLQPILGTEGES